MAMPPFKKNGLRSKSASINGTFKIKLERKVNTLPRLKPSLEPEAWWKTMLPLEKTNNWKKCKIITRCSLIKKKQEKTIGNLSRRTWISMRSTEPTCLISWLRMKPPPNYRCVLDSNNLNQLLRKPSLSKVRNLKTKLTPPLTLKLTKPSIRLAKLSMTTS